MKYTQISKNQVFTAISNGNNVMVCDFGWGKILHTNELTVESIRNYLAKDDVAFFKAEETTA